MRAWYDILSFEGINRRVDEAGIETSVAFVRELVAQQNARGIASERIFLAGFSQGGAMTYQAGLTHPEKLAGLIVLSGYIPSKGLIDASFSDANRDTPIFAAHGSFDDVLNVRLGEEAVDFAREQAARWNGIRIRCRIRSAWRKWKHCASGWVRACAGLKRRVGMPADPLRQGGSRSVSALPRRAPVA